MLQEYAKLNTCCSHPLLKIHSIIFIILLLYCTNLICPFPRSSVSFVNNLYYLSSLSSLFTTQFLDVFPLLSPLPLLYNSYTEQSRFFFWLFYLIHCILPSWPIGRPNCSFPKCHLPISMYFPALLILSPSRISILFHFLVHRRKGTRLIAPHHGKRMDINKCSEVGIWWVNDSVIIALVLCD